MIAGFPIVNRIKNVVLIEAMAKVLSLQLLKRSNLPAAVLEKKRKLMQYGLFKQ